MTFEFGDPCFEQEICDSSVENTISLAPNWFKTMISEASQKVLIPFGSLECCRKTWKSMMICDDCAWYLFDFGSGRSLCPSVVCGMNRFTEADLPQNSQKFSKNDPQEFENWKSRSSRFFLLSIYYQGFLFHFWCLYLLVVWVLPKRKPINNPWNCKGKSSNTKAIESFNHKLYFLRRMPFGKTQAVGSQKHQKVLL